MSTHVTVPSSGPAEELRPGQVITRKSVRRGAQLDVVIIRSLMCLMMTSTEVNHACYVTDPKANCPAPNNHGARTVASRSQMTLRRSSVGTGPAED